MQTWKILKKSQVTPSFSTNFETPTNKRCWDKNSNNFNSDRKGTLRCKCWQSNYRIGKFGGNQCCTKKCNGSIGDIGRTLISKCWCNYCAWYGSSQCWVENYNIFILYYNGSWSWNFCCYSRGKCVRNFSFGRGANATCYFAPLHISEKLYFINQIFVPHLSSPCEKVGGVFFWSNFKVQYPDVLGVLCVHLHVSSIVMVTIPSSNIAWPSPNFALPPSCIFQLSPIMLISSSSFFLLGFIVVEDDAEPSPKLLKRR